MTSSWKGGLTQVYFLVIWIVQDLYQSNNIRVPAFVHDGYLFVNTVHRAIMPFPTVLP